MTKFFVDKNGKYLGGFDGHSDEQLQTMLPDAVEIPGPPEHAQDVLVAGAWDKSKRDKKKTLTVDSLAAALKAKGVLSDAEIEDAKK